MATRLYSVVFDSADPSGLARWWSDALGWPVTHEEPDEVVVESASEQDRVPALVFVPVPEAKAVKNRVHLDLASDSPDHQAATVERLVRQGATHVDVGQADAPWVVLADIEGNEFCVLEERDRHRGRGPLASIVVDALDPPELARFGAAASGWPVSGHGETWTSLHNPDGSLPDLDFVRVPEAKTVKHRVHLDVAPFATDDQAAEVARLLE